MAAMIFGVLIIVGDSIGTGNLFGDLMALCSALLIASAITISRASGKDMGFTALIGVIFPFLVAAVMVGQRRLPGRAPWWIIFNGAIVMPISFFCLATGPRYISGPEVAMFYLLGNRARAGLGVDDLCRNAVAQQPDRRRHPDRRAGRAFALAAFRRTAPGGPN